MESPKIKKFCCPHCGNESHYRSVQVVAELHWWDMNKGHIEDFENNIEIKDRCVVEFICLECDEIVDVNSEKDIKLAITELPKSDS